MAIISLLIICAVGMMGFSLGRIYGLTHETKEAMDGWSETLESWKITSKGHLDLIEALEKEIKELKIQKI